MTEPLYIAKGTAEGSPPIYLYPRMANRHGLVAGATGTGKTVTLQTMAENFSRGGVPVFISDIKGDVSGISQPASEYQSEYGNVSPASVGAIQRGLLTLEEQGVVKFFGEPALNFDDFLQTDANGKGIINVLASDKLAQSPKLYATMLLWLLAELFENLPEVGDLDEPKLVFFFDEAHLLFTDAPDALQDKIEQVVQLIRSKGVGVYFVTQNPLDVPDRVLGQLGNRVQHALRAFTPRDQKAVRTAAQTFRANPDLDIETVITELGVGEALVSFLDEKGTPGVTQRAYILPPRSLIGMITPEQRTEIIKSSLIAGVYEKEVDRESAYEMLQAKADKHVAAAEQLRQEKEAEAAAKKAEAEAKKSEAEQKNEKRSGHARPPNKRVNRNELPKRKPENKHKRSAKQNAPPRTIHSTNSSARWRLRPAEKSRAGSLEICLGRALPGANAKHSLL